MPLMTIRGSSNFAMPERHCAFAARLNFSRKACF